MSWACTTYLRIVMMLCEPDEEVLHRHKHTTGGVRIRPSPCPCSFSFFFQRHLCRNDDLDLDYSLLFIFFCVGWVWWASEKRQGYLVGLGHAWFKSPNLVGCPVLGK